MIASTQNNNPNPGDTATPGSSLDERLDVLCARLKASGLRITQPRVSILQVLLRHDSPVSIETLHSELARARCDLVTVYRCLAVFEELGIVQRGFYHNGTALFQIAEVGRPAYHVVNRTTGGVTTLDPALTAEVHSTVKALENRLKERGYTDLTHIVQFFSRDLGPDGKPIGMVKREA
jgi:Fur family ferric uptake transcriptional regulator